MEIVWTAEREGTGAGAGSQRRPGHTLRPDDARAAHALLRSWPGYRPTPLVDHPALARHAGVGALLWKDESARWDVGSFKALGGGYATVRLLGERLGSSGAGPDELRGRHADALADTTVCCATDGNHGRAVAWAARELGCRAVVFLPAHASDVREERISAQGARVVRVDGRYDDAVEWARREAEDRGWVLVSDTGVAGDTGASGDAGDAGNAGNAVDAVDELPDGHPDPARGPAPVDPARLVIEAYTLLVEEVARDLGDRPPPTHAFVQAGVGGLAAAVAWWCAESWPDAPVRIVLVEPRAAACVGTSLRAGRPVPLDGDLGTVMDCLSAGHVSGAAWPVLRAHADAAVTLPDAAVRETLERLESGALGEPRLAVGPSGVAGLAAVLAATGSDAARAELRLGPESRVLAIGTEEPLG